MAAPRPLPPQHVSARVCPLKEFCLDQFGEYPLAELNVDVEQPTRLRKRQGRSRHFAKLGADATQNFNARRVITPVVRISGPMVH